MARPVKNIDKKIFENLCMIQCTEEEMCDVFEVNTDTLNKWCKKNYTDEKGKPMCFSEVFRQKRGKGRTSLRRKQWNLADKNAAMAIFLGKQYLGQKDIPDDNVDKEDSEAYFEDAGV